MRAVSEFGHGAEKRGRGLGGLTTPPAPCSNLQAPLPPAARPQKCCRLDSHLPLEGAREHALHKHWRPHERPCQQLRLLGHCPRPGTRLCPFLRRQEFRTHGQKGYKGCARRADRYSRLHSIPTARARSRASGITRSRKTIKTTSCFPVAPHTSHTWSHTDLVRASHVKIPTCQL